VHNYDTQQHRASQIISPLTLQTITTAQMLSVGGEGEFIPETIYSRDQIKHNEMSDQSFLERMLVAEQIRLQE